MHLYSGSYQHESSRHCARGRRRCAPSRAISRSGFSLIDVLVSIFVVAILLAIMSPVISEAQHAAWRVVCANNVRQVGLGLALYADDYRDRLPPSVYVDDEVDLASTKKGAHVYFNEAAPSETTTLRISGIQRTIFKALGRDTFSKDGWDGLGLLYESEYVPVAGSFYCPAHNGTQQYENYEQAWYGRHETIRGNYQYRGEGPNGESRLTMVEPKTTALLSDSLRQIDEWSHQNGANVMTADLAVRWVLDEGDVMKRSIPVSLSAASPLPSEFNPDIYRYPIDQTWSIADTIISGKGKKLP